MVCQPFAESSVLTPMKPDPAPPIAHLELKAALLLALLMLLVGGAVVYVLYARGAFEPTQRLVLIADDSEGVQVGMDLTFSGFPIGRVRRIELADDGSARIVIDVPKKDAHRLRTSSVFTLTRGLVGSTSIKAFTGIPTDPPLPDGAERKVLVGDATAELPRLVTEARELVRNMTAITAPDAPLATSLGNVQTVTERLKGPRGALGVLMGNERDAQKLVAALDRTNALLERMDGLVAKTDAQVFGADGLMRDARATIVQLNATLADARATLQKVDAVLEEAQAIAANTKVATTDLGALRAEIEVNLRKVESLVDEINRRWPFARDAEIKLP
jgi:phospholipid/cholesterol/gamma-HCH transport system substrate-binding protein